MKPTTRVVLVRHGETAWNCEHRIQGHLDSPLTQRGERQAQALYERLQSDSFDAIYSSDLGRVRQTAALALGTVDRVQWLSAWRERCFGDWQGQTRSDTEQHVPAPEVEAVFGPNIDPHYVPSAGESLTQFEDRVWQALGDVLSSHSGQTVLVLAHGGVLRACFRRVLGLDPAAPRRFSIINASYNVLRHDGDHWQLETWGDTAHLEQLGFIHL